MAGDGNISTYDPSLPDIRPSEVGVEATATAAYRANRAFTELGSSIEQTGRQLGQDIGQGVKADVGAAYDMAVHKEVAHGSAAESGLINQANDAWNSIMTDPKTDPNDPNIAANFQQKVLQPMLDKFSNGFATEGGQDWAQRRTEAIQQHFISSTSADMGNLAKAAVDKNIKMMSDSDTNTVMTNPARLPFLLNSAQDRINSILATSPNLKGAALAQAKETLPFDYQRGLVRSAAIGAIMQSGDPEGTAKAFGVKYPDLISGADLKVLSSQASTQLRMNNAAAKAQEVATKQLQELQANETASSLMTSRINEDGTIAPATPQWTQQYYKGVKQFSIQPGAKESTTAALIKFGEAETKNEIPEDVSHASTVGLISQISSGQIKDRAPLDKAFVDGKVNKPDYTFALGQLKAVQAPAAKALGEARSQFFKAYPAAFGNAPTQYKALKEAMRQETMLQAKGEDPMSLYDPNSPNFFGAPDNLTKFQEPGLWSRLAAPAEAPSAVPEKDIPSLQPGTVYTAPDGTIRRRAGGEVPRSQ